jgi:Lon protease-like protein
MSDLLKRIPLFPLGSTLFPGGKLALKIFEVRYLDMIKSAHRDKTPFGVVTLEQGSEIRVPGSEDIEFSSIGTLSHLTDIDAMQPSLLMILCEGGQRFKIHHRERLKNGLWMADVELIADDPLVDVPHELIKAADTFDKLAKSFDQQGVEVERLPFNYPLRLNECGWVANRWAELLPINPKQKIHLLAQDNPRVRLDLVHEILEEMGVYEPS